MIEIQVLEETREYYKTDTSRRATNSMGECSYYLEEDGVVKMCGIGRMLIEPKNFKDCYRSVAQLYSTGTLQPNLKEQYKGFDRDFYNQIQSFHDNNNYWNKEGLTQEGLKRYYELIKKYETK